MAYFLVGEAHNDWYVGLTVNPALRPVEHFCGIKCIMAEKKYQKLSRHEMEETDYIMATQLTTEE